MAGLAHSRQWRDNHRFGERLYESKWLSILALLSFVATSDPKQEIAAFEDSGGTLDSEIFAEEVAANNFIKLVTSVCLLAYIGTEVAKFFHEFGTFLYYVMGMLVVTCLYQILLFLSNDAVITFFYHMPIDDDPPDQRWSVFFRHVYTDCNFRVLH